MGTSKISQTNDILGVLAHQFSPTFDTELLRKASDPLDAEVAQLCQPSDAFPVDVFAPKMQEVIRATVAGLNFQPDYIAASILFAASVAIGNTCQLRVKASWLERAIIYLVLVGNKGCGKSHPPEWALEPISKAEDRLYKNYKDAKREHAVQQCDAKKGKDGEGMPEPVFTQTIYRDATVEALAQGLSNNQRGVAVYADEFASWHKNINKYNGGSDEEFFLTSWSGKRATTNRTSKFLRIPKPFIGIMGTTQPGEPLEAFFKGGRAANGMTDRVLFVLLENLKRRRPGDEDVPQAISDFYGQTIERLLSIPFELDHEENIIFQTIELSPEARKVLDGWIDANIDEDNLHDSNVINGISAKLETYLYRFALTLHLLKWAECGSDFREIDAQTAEGAVRLVRYFKEQGIKTAARALQAKFRKETPLDGLSEVKRAIYEELPSEFTTGEGQEVAETGNRLSGRAFSTWLTDPMYFKQLKKGRWRKIIDTHALRQGYSHSKAA